MAEAQSIWKMAFRNLSNQNKTTILTVAAIAVCVMTFVSIFSILDGLQLSVEKVIRGFYGEEGRSAYVLPASDEIEQGLIPRAVAEEYRGLDDVYGLSEEDVVNSYYQGREVDLLGVNLDDLDATHGFQGIDGRSMEKGPECMVGSTAAEILGIDVDQEISLELDDSTVDLLVTGIYEAKTSLNANILVNNEFLSSRIPRFKVNTSMLRIKLKTGNLESVAEFTEENHPELRIKESVQVSKFFQKSIINISRLLSTIIIFVILLMVLGIYNSMNMVVSERKREIGIIRAMGARRSFIVKLFMAESTMLSLLGGLFGVGLGIAMSHGITSIFSIFVAGSSSVAPLTKLTTIGWAMFASLSIGLIGGISPASNASKVEISRALTEV